MPTATKVKPKAIKPKFSLIPKSKAKNAYELLDEVSAVVLAEPTRMDLQVYAHTPQHVAKMKTPPACGTVGCIAGWVTFLRNRVVLPFGIGSEAAVLLGFDPFAYDSPTDGLFAPRGNDVPSRPGTKRHAQQVVGRIRKFQHAHEAQLKARTY